MPCTKLSGAQTTTVAPKTRRLMWKFTASTKNPPSIFRILSEASADGACLVKVTDIGKNAGCWLFGNHVLAPRDHKARLADWRQYPLSRWNELKHLVERNREYFKRPAPAFASREIKVESVAVELRKWTPKPGDFFRVPDNPKQQISKRDRRRGVTKPSEAAQPFKCTSITEAGVNATAADGTQGFLPYSCTFEPTLENEATLGNIKFHFDPNALSTHKAEGKHSPASPFSNSKLIKPESRIVHPETPKNVSDMHYPKKVSVMHWPILGKNKALVMGDSHAHEAPNLQLQEYMKTRPHLLSFNAANAEARVFANGLKPLLDKVFPIPTTPLPNNPLDKLINQPTSATPRGRHDVAAELVSMAAPIISKNIIEFTIKRADGSSDTWMRAEAK